MKKSSYRDLIFAGLDKRAVLLLPHWKLLQRYSFVIGFIERKPHNRTAPSSQQSQFLVSIWKSLTKYLFLFFCELQIGHWLCIGKRSLKPIQTSSHSLILNHHFAAGRRSSNYPLGLEGRVHFTFNRLPLSISDRVQH